MPARVLVIGLDAVNATFIDRWVEAGHLPHIAALRRRASAFQLEADCMETLPGAIWTDIAFGEPAERHGLFYFPEQFQPDEGMCRKLAESEADMRKSFWGVASAAGRRCAVVDVPFMPLLPDFNGVQLREFAVHDTWAGPASHPPALLDELYKHCGEPPLHHFMCDHRVATAGRKTIFEELLVRTGIKTNVLLNLIAREHWDLFFAVYGDAHCGAHQLWPTRESGKLVTSVDGLSDPWEPLRRLYTKIDEGIGALVAAAGREAQVILFTSHGVGFYLGGPQLLPEILRRLGLSSGWEWPGRRTLRRLALMTRRRIHVPQVEDVAALHTPQAQRLRAWLGAERYPGQFRRCVAFAMPNNRIGAIRLKIAGRDRDGSVAPSDASGILDAITGELDRLVDPRTGLKLVRRVDKADKRFGPDRSKLTPDLLVKFRTDIGPVERAYSPRLGTIYEPNARPHYVRTGDHVPQSRAWIATPSGRGRAKPARRNILDLAPTILSLLDVAPAPHMAGRALHSDAATASTR
jgi:predicted AlkP superfamily phosphohydrolase/phosphomutase